MSSNVKANLGLSLRTLLKPLVRLLISQGITHGDFSEAAKDVYIEMAIRHSADGRVNKSKIAILTGLTRKEVANVIQRAVRSEAPAREFSRPSRVLSGWHNDPDYVGPYGLPLEIPYDNPSSSGHSPSFVHLVKTYSGDMPPKGMLEELTRVGAVIQQDDKTLKAVRRVYMPQSLSPFLIERFGDVGFNILSTIASNVEKEGSGKGPFDRAVFSDNPLTKSELESFDGYLKKKGQEFLETVDNWFSSNVTEKQSGEDAVDTGVAMVQYIEWNPEEKQSLHELLISMGHVSDSKTPSE
jgi:hypothetical protein